MSSQLIKILINGETERTRNVYEFVKETLREFKDNMDLYFVYFGSLPLGMGALVNDILEDTNHVFLVVDYTPNDIVEYSNDIVGKIIYINSYFIVENLVILNHSFFKFHEEFHILNILSGITAIAISDVPLDIWEDSREDEYTSTHESVEILRKSIVQFHVNKIIKNNPVSIVYYINNRNQITHTVKIDEITFSEIKTFTYE